MGSSTLYPMLSLNTTTQKPALTSSGGICLLNDGMASALSQTQPPQSFFSSDASGSWGLRSSVGPLWFQIQWPPHWAGENIATPFPLTEDTLCYFVSFLHKHGLKHQTIKTYLSGLRHAQIAMGLFKDSPFPTPPSNHAANYPKALTVLRA